MRSVIQRVETASVLVDEKKVASIGGGLLIFLAVHQNDSEKEAHWMATKIATLRIFSSHEGKMDKSVIDENKEVLVVSQFTLYGNVEKGRRPDFLEAALPEKAEKLYEHFIACLKKELPDKVHQGQFRASMKVKLVNDGPVTIIINSPKGM
jgi:D-aminoacyl-tRNA deacylase